MFFRCCRFNGFFSANTGSLHCALVWAFNLTLQVCPRSLIQPFHYLLPILISFCSFALQENYWVVSGVSLDKLTQVNGKLFGYFAVFLGFSLLSCRSRHVSSSAGLWVRSASGSSAACNREKKTLCYLTGRVTPFVFLCSLYSGFRFLFECQSL